MSTLFVLYAIATVLGLMKAKAPSEVALVLAPSLLVVIAVFVPPYLVEVHGLLLKALCLFLAAGLPVVARAYIEAKHARQAQRAKPE